ncbi:MAG: LytR family transcriptional regulator, partial [Mycobacteriaceae bacterium]
MVADITQGSAVDKSGQPFRRRNYRPGIIAVAVLAVLTAMSWAFVLTRPVDMGQAAACNAPPTPTDPAAPKLGQLVSAPSMVNVAPAKLADTKIRVM